VRAGGDEGNREFARPRADLDGAGESLVDAQARDAASGSAIGQIVLTVAFLRPDAVRCEQRAGMVVARYRKTYTVMGRRPNCSASINELKPRSMR